MNSRTGSSKRSAALLVAVLSIVGVAGCGRAQNASTWPKVAHLRNGTTVTVNQSGRVIVRNRHELIASDSCCRSYTNYSRWVKFMTAFQAAVKRGDRAAITSDVAYPLEWNHGHPHRTTRVKSPRELLSRYGAMFQPAVVAAIIAPDPRALFCQNLSEATIGSGVVWGDVFANRFAIVTINAPDT